MESTLVEVLILNGLGDDGDDEMVILVEKEILGDFEGLHGGGA